MTCGFALKTLQQQSGSQFKLVSYAQQAADGFDRDPRNHTKQHEEVS
jgi:hypothetical protein